MNGNNGVIRQAPAITGKVPKIYPWLSEDRHCDICVIGGGLTGAMCVLTAAELGLSAVLITSDGVGFGNTGHITGNITYDAGQTLSELDRIMSVDDALKLYSMGFDALDCLGNLCRRLEEEFKKSGISSGFRRCDSLIWTDDPTELELMEREYLTVSKKFSCCSFLNRGTAQNSFEFSICGGILTKEGAACLEPYSLAHLCLMKAEEYGAEIFEQTEAIDIQIPKTDDGCVIIKTSTYRTVYADRLILATGSEGIHSLTRQGKKRVLYVSVGVLPENEAGWSGKCALRTFGKRGISCSISPKRRIAAYRTERERIVGGIFGKMGESEKYRHLSNYIKNILPHGEEAGIKYEYSHSYYTLPDRMPLIGTHEAYKNCLFALCTGPCSPIFSVIAANAIRDILSGSNTKIFQIFDPIRV